MPKKIVYDPTKDKSPKQKIVETTEKDVSSPKVEKPEDKPDEPITEFSIKKGLNPYGFIHIPKKARASLPFSEGVSLKARIERKMLILKSKDEA